MPTIECPFPACTFVTPDVTNDLACTLLQIHASGVHTTTSTTAQPTTVKADVEKVRRPTLSLAGSSEDWSYFQTRWTDYVEATKITGKDKVIQLLECCNEELRKDLSRSAGGSLVNKSEEDVLAAIKKLAVREENTMVARAQLYEMRQDRDEPIRSYGARIRGQAGVCKYTLQCPSCDSEVNYTDHILRDVLTRGIADNEIQLDLLSDANQDMELEKAFQFIEAKESGKRSANKLLHTQGVENINSRYRQMKKLDNNGASSANTDNCTYCGKRGHGKYAPLNIRRSKCSAYNHTCAHCNRRNHLETVCRSKEKGTNKQFTDDSGAIFQTLCAFSTSKTKERNAIALDHHLYSHIQERWIQQHSKPQPFIELTVSIHLGDYRDLGFELPTPSSSKTIFAMADTGCQSCLASMNTIRKLGLSEKDLIPVTMRMHAANSNNIEILGAVILQLSGKSKSGELLETRQLTYVTNDAEKFFLSREACINLGIIPNSFPTIGEATQHDSCNSSGTTGPEVTTANQPDSATTSSCNCPCRQTPPPKPTELPFPVNEENRAQLQQWLLDYYHSSTFNTCEHQPLPMMEGPPLRLMVDPSAEPVAHHTPIPVPLHWQDDVKAGLEQDTRLGVIEPVPIGEPVTWCHRMVICSKKSGKPRRTVDFQPLNAHATRETHHTQSPFHQARSVPHNKKKTVFDCWNGYHSVPLHGDDRHLTTFITPWGRFRYKTAPQGYIASGDGYSRRFDEIVSDIPNKTKCVDDTLLWSDNLTESFFQAVEWLDICGRHGITLNPDKFVFAQDTVTFAGFEITNDSVRPCQKYLDAIQNFPTPTNVTDMRSWFGLINQVSYAFASTDRLLPFRLLLKPGTPFTWTTELDSLFAESKSVIISEIEEGVRIFDKSKPTCLATDWSKDGIGYWLFQKHCECPQTKPFCCPTGWKTTLVGSRFTHAAESRYAPIEGEALAVADALDKARYFVLGCTDLIIAVDHKPLLKIFGDRSLNDISNTRLLNIKEKTLRYKFSMVHIPGVKNKVADAMSRHPTGTVNPAILHLQDDIASMTSPPETPPPTLNIHTLLAGIRSTELQTVSTHDTELRCAATSALNSLSLQAVTWDRVKVATNSDPLMLELLKTIDRGFPDFRHELPSNLQEYHQFRDHLYCIDGIALYKDRIIIPPSLRSDVLNALHSAHQCVTPMMARVESSVFWPGITPTVTALRANCNDCNRNAPSQPSAPPTPPIPPEYPFQCICADFFHHQGSTYLVVVDRYSNWPIIERAKDGHKGLIDSLRRVFVTFGIPDDCATDGGPEFIASATTKFLREWGVHHRLSSVAFPHSNCRAEIGVKTVKRLICSNTGPNGELDTDTLQRAILQYRNTPDPGTKLSPAMCVFGRPIKDFIPILPGRYKPHPTWSDTLAAREEALRNRHQRMAERLMEHTRCLPPLVVGDYVRIQNQTGNHPTKWDKTGKVIEVRQFDQYVIRVDGSGRVTLRNRKFLRKYMPVLPTIPRRTIADDLNLPTITRYTPPTIAIQTTVPTITSHTAPPARDMPSPIPQPSTPSPVRSPNATSPNATTLDVIPPTTITTLPDTPQSEHITLPPSPHLSPHLPKKVPLAIRRLMDFNTKGLKE